MFLRLFFSSEATCEEAAAKGRQGAIEGPRVLVSGRAVGAVRTKTPEGLSKTKGRQMGVQAREEAAAKGSKADARAAQSGAEASPEKVLGR